MSHELTAKQFWSYLHSASACSKCMKSIHVLPPHDGGGVWAPKGTKLSWLMSWQFLSLSLGPHHGAQPGTGANWWVSGDQAVANGCRFGQARSSAQTLFTRTSFCRQEPICSCFCSWSDWVGAGFQLYIFQNQMYSDVIRSEYIWLSFASAITRTFLSPVNCRCWGNGLLLNTLMQSSRG